MVKLPKKDKATVAKLDRAYAKALAANKGTKDQPHMDAKMAWPIGVNEDGTLNVVSQTGLIT